MSKVISRDKKANPGDKVFLATLGGIVMVIVGAFVAIALPGLIDEGKAPSKTSIVKGN
jgi:hypothetical protein